MKSQIILQNRGFLTTEIMLAFSLMTIFTISTFTLLFSTQELKMWSLNELERLESEPLVYAYSDYIEDFGRNSCLDKIDFDEDKIKYFPDGLSIGLSNKSSDIEVRNGIIYLTADATSLSPHDFFIIDSRDMSIISSINTGPGVSAIEVAGPYVFLAESSTINQLQILDIHDRRAPRLISEIKLPLPTATTTAPFATSIFYSKGFIYLGTEKWDGAEFSVIDVSDVHDPTVVGSLETGTLINDIYVSGNTAYLAGSDNKQMRIVDISDKSQPVLIDSFSPSGWQTQEGKVLDYFQGAIGLGRTVGGFNVEGNHEAFVFFKSSEIFSRDVPGGVYGMLLRDNNIFLLTHDLQNEFQVFDKNLDNKIFELPLGQSPVKMACDGSNLFFATGGNTGVSILKLYE
ncbi:MAG TPA: hypothetical protein VJI66_02240 [Candidatus Paceibacterota bacterium]